ncbi:MAG: TolC family protein [Chloroflexi bacterium]|nr:MAG: TolC family protein [Chloroflexota bacterium]
MKIVTHLGWWRTFIFIFVLGSGLASRMVYADQVNTLGLKEAVTKTLEQNPQLYQYSFIQESLIAKRSASDLAPALNLEVEVENFAGSGTYQSLDSAETTIALSSVIEMGGTRQARVSVIDARSTRIELERQAATLDVLGELTSIFIVGLATQTNLELAKEALTLSESLQKTVERRAEQGGAPEAEVMRAKAAVYQAKIRVNALQKQFERQSILLSRLWGDTHTSFTALDGDLFEFGSSDSFASLYARVKTSPAIQIFASEARLKEAEAKLAQANSRSDLVWRLGIRHLEETDDTAVIAGVSIPLFSKNRNRGNVRAAIAERDAVEYAEQQALLNLHSRLYKAYSLREQNRTAVNQMRLYAIPTLEKALTLTQEAYEIGRYRYQDLVSAQIELLTVKQQQIEAAKNALLSQALIEQLTGEALSQDNIQ